MISGSIGSPFHFVNSISLSTTLPFSSVTLRTHAEPIRNLAYRLYTLCERKGWADDARPYNELITSWVAIEAASHEKGHYGSQANLEI